MKLAGESSPIYVFMGTKKQFRTHSPSLELIDLMIII